MILGGPTGRSPGSPTGQSAPGCSFSSHCVVPYLLRYLFERAIRKYRSHPSIQRIIDNLGEANEFDFQTISVVEVEKQIRKIKAKKGHSVWKSSS